MMVNQYKEIQICGVLDNDVKHIHRVSTRPTREKAFVEHGVEYRVDNDEMVCSSDGMIKASTTHTITWTESVFVTPRNYERFTRK